MKILAINAGSSSLKFQLLEMPDELKIVEGVIDRIGIDKSEFKMKLTDTKIHFTTDIRDHEEAIDLLLEILVQHKVIKDMKEIKGIGHRVVHGGEEYSSSVVIDNDVIKKLKKLYDLAPLHNPSNVMGIEAFNKALPDATAVAVFDTAFHQTMKPDAFLYAIPYEWYEELGVRKYGFHGTSHKYVSSRISEILGRNDLKVIVAHLGNGASLCAIDSGKSIDTTMGFTPLAGIPMGTRSGDIDPAIISFIMHKKGWNEERTISSLNKKSGFLGISGISSDARDIIEAAKNGHERSDLTLDIYARRIVDVIGGYHVLLGGLDAIVFTAGIGENAIELREKIMNQLEALGVKGDVDKNNVRGVEQLISTEDSSVKVYLIPTNEEVMIARDTYQFISK